MVPFVRGDVVMLMSGGPKMTVAQVDESNKLPEWDMISVVYFKPNHDKVVDKFRADLLKLVPTETKKEEKAA